MPPAQESVSGFTWTFDRRGARALVQHDAGWAGTFIGVVEDGGAVRLLCKTGNPISAAWLDDDHVAIAAGNETWVGRIAADAFVVVSGVEGVSGPIAVLPNDMLAVGWPDADGLRLLAFRDGRLRLYRGAVKRPKDASDIDRTLVVHDGRVFAVGTDNLELTHAALAGDWDPGADWNKAVKKLVKRSGVPIAETSASQPEPPQWRFDGEEAAVRVGDQWRTLALPEGLSGPHYAELAEPERGFLVGALAQGAIDGEVAWLVTGGRKLMRAPLSTGVAEVVANVSSVHPDDFTRGVFPQPDGRIVVLGSQHIGIVDGDAQPWGRALGFTVCAALALGGPLIAYASVWPGNNKNGVPMARLSLVEIGAFPRDWLTWEIPMYAPSLRFDGRTLTATEGDRALAFDLEAALAWFPNFAGRTDVPALPPKGT